MLMWVVVDKVTTHIYLRKMKMMGEKRAKKKGKEGETMMRVVKTMAIKDIF